MPTILVVDDDPSVLRLLRATLDGLGDVVVATSGEAALQLTAAGALPDLVVLDVVMPGTSGLDVLHAWRADPRTRDLEVVLLSPHDAPVDQAAGDDVGADAYVAKPVDVDVLQSLLSAMLADRGSRKQAVLDEFRGLQVGDFPV